MTQELSTEVKNYHYAVFLNGGDLPDKILKITQRQKDALDMAIQRNSPIEIDGVTIMPSYIRWVERREPEQDIKYEYVYDKNRNVMVKKLC